MTATILAVLKSITHGQCFSILTKEENRRHNSNLESGEGRFDILLEPKKDMLPAIVMELKAVRKEFSTEEERNCFLKYEAGRALLQINKKEYTTNLQMHGIKSIILYGLAFHGKRVEIVSDDKNL